MSLAPRKSRHVASKEGGAGATAGPEGPADGRIHHRPWTAPNLVFVLRVLFLLLVLSPYSNIGVARHCVQLTTPFLVHLCHQTPQGLGKVDREVQIEQSSGVHTSAATLGIERNTHTHTHTHTHIHIYTLAQEAGGQGGHVPPPPHF